jgi:putative restriction endonuclease
MTVVSDLAGQDLPEDYWALDSRIAGRDSSRVQAFVAVTDNQWFRFLSSLAGIDEVNFWQPRPHSFRALEPGQPLLFKLHHPEHFIVGGGFFAHYSVLPCGLAWDAFGSRNGVDSLQQMVDRIRYYRGEPAEESTEIGCIMLEQPFFFPRQLWIPAPGDFAKNIVTGKGYDLREHPDLWDAVQSRLLTLEPSRLDMTDAEVMFTERWIRARLGQGTFRTLVTDAYSRRCALTGEKILLVLQAAHIRPVTEGGNHRVDNGLLLRSDVHTLFERGYLGLRRDYRLMMSRRLRREFANGEFYYRLEGEPIWLPTRPQDRPSPEYLEWHADTKFVA